MYYLLPCEHIHNIFSNFLRINITKHSILAWLSWLLISIFYAYQYVLRVMPNVMKDEIMQKFHINATQFGQYAGVYYISYSLMHIPIGILFMKVRANILFALAVLLCALSPLTILLSDSWLWALVGRIMIGASSCAAVVGGFKVFQDYFKDRFTVMFGYMLTIGLLGAIYGGGPVAELLQIIGWKQLTYYLVFIGCLLSALMLFIIPSNKGNLDNKDNIVGDILSLFKNKTLLLMSVCGGLMIGPLEGFAEVLGASFLNAVHGVEWTKAAHLSSIIFLFMAVGTATLPRIAPFFNHQYNFLLSASGLISCIFFVLLILPLDYRICDLAVILAVIGFLCAYPLYIFGYAPTIVEKRLSSLAPTATNMIMIIFGEVYHTAIGITMDATTQAGVSDKGVFLYDKDSYIYGMVPIIIGLFIAGICFMLQQRKTR